MGKFVPNIVTRNLRQVNDGGYLNHKEDESVLILV